MTGTIKTYYSFLRFLKSQRRKVAALQLSGKLEHWLISSTAQLVLKTRASSKPSALPPTEYQIWLANQPETEGVFDSAASVVNTDQNLVFSRRQRGRF